MRVIAFFVVLLATAVAEAYPQFQLSLGPDRCVTCHVSPAGGGLLNAYGRDEAGDTVSRGGDGRFLHGLWESPSWLTLGGDFRGATAIKYRNETELLAFPMQTDLYARIGGEHVSFNLTAGLRGGARSPQPPLLERLVSREHYVMYQRDSGSYVRAGRFFPVFGIRSQDHTTYVRRYLGFHTLEEPYALAGGYFATTWEAHVSAFVPRPVDLLGAGLKTKGVVGYYEKRILDDTAAFGLQAKFATASTDNRMTVGIVGKRWFPAAEVMLLGELDVVRQDFAEDIGPTRYQLAAYGGASKFVAKGLMVGAAVQRFQADLRQRSSRDALDLNIQYFPRAHFELHLLTRFSDAGDFDDPGLLTFLQLHYYL